MVDQDVEELVRALAHVADAHPERPERRLATQRLQFLVDEDAFQAAGPRSIVPKSFRRNFSVIFAASLNGLPQVSAHRSSRKPLVSTTSVSPSQWPTE
jgi:hypothetical protein